MAAEPGRKPPVPQRRFEAARLARAAKGTDLWVAVEAAQFGRLVDQPQPKGELQRQVIARFLRRFTEAVESWERIPPVAQSEILGQLGRDLDDLALQGLYVHAGTIERDRPGQGQAQRLPIAIVVVSRENAATTTVRISLDLTFGD